VIVFLVSDDLRSIRPIKDGERLHPDDVGCFFFSSKEEVQKFRISALLREREILRELYREARRRVQALEAEADDLLG